MPLKLGKRADRPHWWITGTLKGVRVRESTGTDSRAHAEAILAKRQAQILDHSVYGEKATATFAEAVELYVTHGGEVRFLKPLVLRWGDWRIPTITASEVSRAVGDLYPGCKPATITRQLYVPLNAVLKHACKAGLCDPTRFQPPKTERKTAVKYATDDWLDRILPFCNVRLGAILIFMSYTGARISEACRLKWADVHAGRRKALLEQTKTEPREVALAPVVIDALTTISGARDPNALVFGYRSRRSVNHAVDRALARANRRFAETGQHELPRLSPHQIGRHGFAGRLLNAGHSLKVVQAAGGWKSITIVSDIYGHLEQSITDAAVIGVGTKLTPTLGTHIKKIDKTSA